MSYGSGYNRRGYEDAGPRVKQYGVMENPEDEQIDPKILAAQADFERRYNEHMAREVANRASQTYNTYKWTPHGVLPQPPREKPAPVGGDGFPPLPASPQGSEATDGR